MLKRKKYMYLLPSLTIIITTLRSSMQRCKVETLPSTWHINKQPWKYCYVGQSQIVRWVGMRVLNHSYLHWNKLLPSVLNSKRHMQRNGSFNTTSTLEILTIKADKTVYIIEQKLHNKLSSTKTSRCQYKRTDKY